MKTIEYLNTASDEEVESFGKFISVMGRPGSGKTLLSFGLAIRRAMLTNKQVTVKAFNNEDRIHGLTSKLLSLRKDVPIFGEDKKPMEKIKFEFFEDFKDINKSDPRESDIYVFDTLMLMSAADDCEHYERMARMFSSIAENTTGVVVVNRQPLLHSVESASMVLKAYGATSCFVTNHARFGINIQTIIR